MSLSPNNFGGYSMNPRTARAFDATPTTQACVGPNRTSNEEPTLARTVSHAGQNVAQCHEWVDRIEMALFGPEPRAAEGSPPLPDGMMSHLGSVASQSAVLSVRLSRIAERIGC